MAVKLCRIPRGVGGEPRISDETRQQRLGGCCGGVELSGEGACGESPDRDPNEPIFILIYHVCATIRTQHPCCHLSQRLTQVSGERKSDVFTRLCRAEKGRYSAPISFPSKVPGSNSFLYQFLRLHDRQQFRDSFQNFSKFPESSGKCKRSGTFQGFQKFRKKFGKIL